MAVYNITSLNSMASGTNRNFLNMDVELDAARLRLRDFLHVLALDEKGLSGHNVLSGDILLEQRSGDYAINRYISREFTLSSLSEEDYQLCCRERALAREESATGLILDENGIDYVEDGRNGAKYIRLVLSCCTPELRAKLRKFLEGTVHYGKIFEVELRQNEQPRNITKGEMEGQTLPLYEMEDICVKSKNRIKNNNLRNFDGLDGGRNIQTEDMYLPEGADVVDFTQVGTNAYLFTKSTTSGCDRLFGSTSRAKTRQTFKLDHATAGTVLYPSLSDLQAALLAETGDQVSSYRQALNIYQTDAAVSAFGSRSTDNFFEPVENVHGIRYNYVAQTPLSETVSRYNGGNVYGDIFGLKNQKNSQYDMQMSSAGSLAGCREYTGIFECGGQIYLKYNDNLGYSWTPTEHGSVSSLTKNDCVDAKCLSGGYSYQKLERFNPVGASSSSNKHKSFFFSVNIAEDFDQYNEDGRLSTQTLIDALKCDITTAIKEIAENVCPANTQLFDVYYGGSY